MPRHCEWIVRLAEIRQELERLTAPVVDRSVFESVFRVRRRRAIQLLHRFGGYQCGRTFLIDRAALVRELAGLEGTEDVRLERRRKERLAAELERFREHARASRIAVRVPAEVYGARLDSLPEGVRLTPGRLTVAFSDPQELLARLFALAQALANDIDRLEAFAPPGGAVRESGG
jgi:hypothetical protein